MNKTMRLLHEHAEDRLFNEYLKTDPTYIEGLDCAIRCDAYLRAVLDENGQRCLDKLRQAETDISDAEGQALFQFGFRMALELAR